MMFDRFDSIRDLYRVSHEQHGDSPAALLTPKGRHELRFRPVVEELERFPSASVLDYGCGIGLLLSHLLSRFGDVDYTGLDITPSFVESCKSRLGDNGRFELIQPDQPIANRYDIVVISGVFNLTTSEDPAASLAYVERRLGELLEVCNEVLIVDFLSPFVDYVQEGAQHIPVETVCEWLVDSSLRRFVVRHDLLPYEYTVVVYKDSRIRRPENIFEVGL